MPAVTGSSPVASTMSYVTSVVLLSSHIPPQTRQALAQGYHHDGSYISFPLMDVLAAETAGNKAIEADIGVGAWNYLDWDQFCYWLRTLTWYTTVVAVGEANGDTGPRILVIPGVDNYSITVAKH